MKHAPRPWIPLLAALLFFLRLPSAFADLTQEQLNQAKEATGLVIADDGSGSAFCISESGIFVTSNHVVAHPGKSLEIVLNPATKNEKRYPARVLRNLEAADLAILKVELDRKVPALPIGDDATLFETQQIFAFGYPFGRMLATDAKSFPSISVNLGRVTSLRKKGDALDAIQLDAQVNPGNSGGPVLDDKGKVVGVIFSGVIASGVNFAKPISLLKSALAEPLVTVTAPAIPFEKRFAPAEFVITVDWLVPPSSEPAVSLDLTSEGNTRHAAATKGPDGKYRVSLAALATKPASRPQCQILITFAGGQLAGKVDDFPLLIDGKSQPLSGIKVLERKAGATDFTADGKRAGPLPELEKLTVDLGAGKMPVDARKADKLEITPIGLDPGPISYQATVTSAGGKAESSAKESLSLSAVPSPANPAAIVSTASTVSSASPANPRAKPMLTELREFPLPSAADDVVTGADGALLIFHLKDARKLAVFDVSQLKMRGYINLAEEPALFAGGSRHILVAYPGQNVLQRYSAQTLEKERTVTAPAGEVTNLTMGYSSPHLALLVLKGQSSYSSVFRIFDTEKMAVLNPDDDLQKFSRINGDNLIIRASGDGRTYGISRTATSPSGFSLLTYKNNQLETFYEHESPGLLIPNADGSLIFTSSEGIYTPAYTAVVKMRSNYVGGTTLIPSYNPMYFLAVPFGESRSSSRKSAPPRNVALHVGRSEQPLVTLPEPFAEMMPKDGERFRSNRDPFSLDKRYHFYPQWNLFLTIPPTNDRIVARPVDPQKILNEKGIDYLYVVSTTPPARASQPYQYQIEAASKAGGVTFSLQSGPAGVTVSPSGLVRWAVPTKTTEETVIVSLKDASGQEAFHTFQITVSS